METALLQTELILKTRSSMPLIPLTAAYVEQAALALGLDAKSCRELALAAEEIFAYLCLQAAPDQAVSIGCRSGVYYARVEFVFHAHEINLSAFNLTRTAGIEETQSPDDMGLLIASRLVDRFRILKEHSQDFRLVLVKEKKYPAVSPVPPPEAKPFTTFKLSPPHEADLKLFSELVCHNYSQALLPSMFQYPGKVLDMAAAGDLNIMTATGSGGSIAGGIAWHWDNAKTVECFGPYGFGIDSPSHGQMASSLMEACIAAIAKTTAVGLLNRHPTALLPDGYMEPLGALDITRQGHAPESVTVYYRHMHEDPGSRVWAHPDLVEFLETQYNRLVLPRSITGVKHQGETDTAHSVLSVDFDRNRNAVTFRPIWYGRDAAANIESHLKLMHREGVNTVFFEMDMGLAWQTGFTPGLISSGFTPRLVLPYGGKGDIVLFQCQNA